MTANIPFPVQNVILMSKKENFIDYSFLLQVLVNPFYMACVVLVMPLDM